jgi:hypothetical protein
MYGNPLLFIKFGVNIEECNKEYCMLLMFYTIYPILENTNFLKLLRANWHLANSVGSFSPGGREGATMSWMYPPVFYG